MGCERYREALSARLDGEDEPGERPALDRHLAGCAGCRDWLEAAAAVTRLARTGPVAAPTRVAPEILAAVPAGGRGRGRLALGLRAVLAGIGVAQFLLGAAQIAVVARSAHPHAVAGTGVGVGVGSGHLWHESAAWNLALGAGFAFVALRRTRPASLLPLLHTFIAALVLLSVSDLLAGQVGPARLAGHGFLVAGYLITVALARPALDPGRPPARHGGGRVAAA